jgi:hypothetical protein
MGWDILSGRNVYLVSQNMGQETEVKKIVQITSECLPKQDCAGHMVPA